MKVKLLKKLHNRYSWYFNKEKFPVLIDNVRKTATVYDLEYVAVRNRYSLKDIEQMVKVDHTEWALRCLKIDILHEWGWNISNSKYKLAVRNYKRKLPK